MRKILLSAVALAALASAALAADLPVRTAPPVYAPPPPIPVFTWTGFHAGLNAGYGFGATRGNSYYLPYGSVSGSPDTAGTATFGGGNRDGFVGGGQVGYDYQFANGVGGVVPGGVVLGAEADAQYNGIGDDHGGGYAFYPAGGDPANYGTAFLNGASARLDRRNDRFFGTVRGRLGYGFDRFLAYGTGGFAYSGQRTGYAYGGGLSYAFTNNVSVTAEYLRVDLDQSHYSNAYYDAGFNAVVVNGNGGRDSFNVVRAKVDYKFDALGAIGGPVVARY